MYVMNEDTFFTKAVALQRSIVMKTLVDTCAITRLGVPTVDSRGISVPATEINVQYNASNDIPCRVEIARAFMNDRDRYQPVVTDNYMIILPHDVDIQDTDNITWNGRKFDIRKLVLAGDMNAFVEALIFYTENYT